MKKIILTLLLVSITFAALGGFELTVIEDTTSPTIHNITTIPSDPAKDSNVTIRVNVSDDSQLHKVLANVSWNSQTQVVELLVNGDYYEGLFTDTAHEGEYTILILANDTSGNLNDTETITFEVGGTTTLCGNNLVEGNEECDGTDLNGKTCGSFGYSDGALSCHGGCTFNKGACTNGGNSGGGGSSSGSSSGGGGGGSGIAKDVDYSVNNSMYMIKQVDVRGLIDELAGGIGFFVFGGTGGESKERIETLQRKAEITRQFSYKVNYIYENTSTTMSTIIKVDDSHKLMIIDEVPKDFAEHADNISVSTYPESEMTVLNPDPIFSFEFLEETDEIKINYTVSAEKGLYMMEDLIHSIENPEIYVVLEAEPIYVPEGKVTLTEVITMRKSIELTPQQMTYIKNDLFVIIFELILLIVILLAFIVYRYRCHQKKPFGLKEAILELEHVKWRHPKKKKKKRKLI